MAIINKYRRSKMAIHISRRKDGFISISSRETENTVKVIHDFTRPKKFFSKSVEDFKKQKEPVLVIYENFGNLDYTIASYTNWSTYPSAYKFKGFFKNPDISNVLINSLSQHQNTGRFTIRTNISDRIYVKISTHGQLGNCGTMTIFNLTQDNIDEATPEQIKIAKNRLANGILSIMHKERTSLLVVADGSGAYFTSGGVPRGCELNCTSIAEEVARIAKGKFKKVHEGINPKTNNPQYLSYVYL